MKGTGLQGERTNFNGISSSGGEKGGLTTKSAGDLCHRGTHNREITTTT